MVDGRIEEMKALYLKGHTLAEIGARFSLTRERVRQLLSKVGISRKDGGRHIRTISRSARRNLDEIAKREATCQRAFGCDYATYSELTGTTRVRTSVEATKNHRLLCSFIQQRINCKRHNIPFDITLPEYAALLGERLDLRGRGRDRFIVCRKDKNLGFTKDNVEVATHSANVSNTRHQQKLRRIARCRELLSAGLSVPEIASVMRTKHATVHAYVYAIRNDRLQAS